MSLAAPSCASCSVSKRLCRDRCPALAAEAMYHSTCWRWAASLRQQVSTRSTDNTSFYSFSARPAQFFVQPSARQGTSGWVSYSCHRSSLLFAFICSYHTHTPFTKANVSGGIRLHACLTALFDPAVFYVRIGRENNLMPGSGSGSGVGGYRRSIRTCHAFMGGPTGAVATLACGVGVLDGEMEVASLSVIFFFPFLPPLFSYGSRAGLIAESALLMSCTQWYHSTWTLCVQMPVARCSVPFKGTRHDTYVARDLGPRGWLAADADGYHVGLGQKRQSESVLRSRNVSLVSPRLAFMMPVFLLLLLKNVTSRPVLTRTVHVTLVPCVFVLC